MTTYLQEYRCRLCRARFVVTEHRVDDGVQDLQNYAIALNHYDQLHHCPEPHAPRIGTGDFVGFVPETTVEYDVADDGDLVPVEPDGQSSFVWVPVEKRLPDVPGYRTLVVASGVKRFAKHQGGLTWLDAEDPGGHGLIGVTHWADGLEGPK